MISHPNVVVVFIVLQLSGSFQVAPEESILLKKLLTGHSSDIRPLPKDLTGPTVVNITVRIVQILDIDERNEVLSMLTWTTMQWEDSTFTWDPGANSNIRNLVFPAGHIWVPDVFIHNTQEISAGFHLGLPQNSDDAPFLAKAEANGLISLGFPHIIRSSCKLNISEYPFDTQYCPVTLGSWTHDKSELIINIVQDQFIQENQFGKKNKAWQQTSSECKKTKTDCPFDQTSNQCNVVQCFVGLKRTAWFEVISYTLPTIIIAVLSIMVFMVPPEAGKRMEVGITLILCIAVYLSLINKKMPPTSESFPLVSKFYGCIIVEITIAMVCSCYCLHIYDPEGLRLLHFPNYLRTLAFGVLARITFYQTKGGKPSRIHPTNAEIKIVERRRKSMLAMNSTLQLNATAHGPKTYSVKPTDNKHFGVKIEDKKENPQAQQQPYAQVRQPQHINQALADNNDQRDSSSEEANEVPAPDLQLADIEEENEEDLLEQQDNQRIGENRCDSGFGEPGGSLSNRSSLVSSNSVRLPIEANSPVNETTCECGLQGCDGHGEVIENTDNPPNAVTEHPPASVSEPNQADESKEEILKWYQIALK
ncbi:neuronal acetylcholine receptor subunit alpha-10-like isoform X1 [Rhopilema esculentum]|uniref:neuronal acetylcholine receptor subunit alpha-10-like isoform X1 n=1 Tax=Rhopilema esculentum TaxID=499914 RepID=UPI0031D3ED61